MQENVLGEIMKKTVLLSAFALLLSNSLLASEMYGPNPGNMTPVGSASAGIFTGAFTYSYPIEVPAGRNGMTPALQLNYNSQAGNGWLGLGWELSVGSIQRSTKNGFPKYDETDTFLFSINGSGQELVKICSYQDGWLYRSKIESSFMRFYYNASDKTWIVWDKTGKKYEFIGLATLKSSDPNFNGSVFYWGLSEVTDTNGNTINYYYPSSTGENYYYYNGPSSTVQYIPYMVTYGGNEKGIDPKYKILLNMENRPEFITNFAGRITQTVDKRLKMLEVKRYDNSFLINIYEFIYSTMTVYCPVSQLSAIKKYAGDGTSCLNPVGFVYNNVTGKDTSTSWNSSLSVDINTFTSGDFNGDGIADVFYSNTASQVVGLSNGINNISYTSWGTFDFTGNDKTKIRTGDFNGDGKTDIVFPTWDTTGGGRFMVHVGISNGASFDFSCWYLQYTSTNPVMGNLYVGDYDGDGRDDMCFYRRSSRIEFYRSENTSFSLWKYVNDSSGDFLPDNTVWIVGKYSGNTRSGVCVYNKVELFFTIAQFDESGGELVTTTIYQTRTSPGNGTLRPGDFNGDGLTDLCFYDTANSCTYVALCDGLNFNIEMWSVNEEWLALPANKTFCTGDFNGDGISDICFYAQNIYGGTSTKVGWSNGNSINYCSVDTNDYGDLPTSNNSAWTTGDFNGDGLTDTCFSYSVYTKVGLTYGEPKQGLMTRIVNELGAYINVAYYMYKSGNTSILPFPVCAVTDTATYDVINGSITKHFSYENGLYDKYPSDKREFLGFGIVTESNMDHNWHYMNYKKSYYLQDWGATQDGVNVFKGRLSEQKSLDSAQNLMARSSYTYCYSEIYPGVYFPKMTKTLNYIGDAYSSTQYLYDSYGNIVQADTYDGGNLASTVITEYGFNADNNLCAYPLHTQTRDGSNNIVSEQWIYYDSATARGTAPILGNVTQIEKLDSSTGGSNNPKVTYKYDLYGNVIEECDAKWNATGGVDGNRIKRVYDSAYQQYVSSVSNVLGHTELYTYNEVGQVLTNTDYNGLVSSTTYDAFYRVSKIIGPEDTEAYPAVEYEYNIYSAPPHRTVVKKRIYHGQPGTINTYSFRDGLGRTIQTLTDYTTSQSMLSGQVVLNDLGLVERSYLPYLVSASSVYVTPDFNKPYASTYYDALGRAIEQVSPDGKHAYTQFSGWDQTITNTNNAQKDYIKDCFGKITEVHEHNDGMEYITKYEYDTLGNLEKITNSEGDITSISYDSLSRKTGMTDPVMGIWVYSYDINGNLTSQTDANLNVSNMAYDRLGRIMSKTYQNMTSSTTYEYDSVSVEYGKGKLARATDPSGITEFKYDVYGNNTEKRRIIDGQIYITSSTCDALGRERWLQYPDGDKVNMNYQLGLLQTVQNADLTYTYANMYYDYSSHGKLSRIIYGNNVNTDYSYSPQTLRLSELKTNNGALQNYGYAYDNVGNITDITDYVSNMTQNFGYDDLNRLILAVGPYNIKTFVYDSIGNMTYNSDGGAIAGSWDMEENSGINVYDSISGSYGTIIGTSTLRTNGRMGKGLDFDGCGSVKIENRDVFNPQDEITLELWAKPRTLDSGYAVSKEGSYKFPKITSTSVQAYLNLSGGVKNISANLSGTPGVWKHYAMTYDKVSLKIYVNGVLVSSTAASGLIATSPGSDLIIGSGFNGRIDEPVILSKALTQEEVQSRYNAVPNMAPDQPKTPIGTPNGNESTLYNFKFQAWDQDGDEIKYLIDWDDGTEYTTTTFLANGTVVVASHSWVNNGSYEIITWAQDSKGSYSALKSTATIIIYDALEVVISTPMPLIGAMAGISESTGGVKSANTIGEWVVSTSTSASKYSYFGYKGQISGNNSLWSACPASYMLDPGGDETAPPAKLTLPQVLALSTTGQIIEALGQYGYVPLKDSNGNHVISNNRWIKYDYDNRPIKVVNADGTSEEYTYDYSGQRVTKQQLNASGVEQSKTTYIGTVYEKTGGNATKNIYANGKLIATKKNTGELNYYHSDHLGSTNLLTDGSGNVVSTTTYTPYGAMYQASGTSASRKYTGQIFDSGTGLYYYNARYYDPQMGIFITPDTIVPRPYDPQSLNRYAYCRNNPINYIDPSGNVDIYLKLERPYNRRDENVRNYNREIGNSSRDMFRGRFTDDFMYNSFLGRHGRDYCKDDGKEISVSSDHIYTHKELEQVENLFNNWYKDQGRALIENYINSSKHTSILTNWAVTTANTVPPLLSDFANSKTVQAYGVYLNSMATSMNPIPTCPEDSLTTAMDAGNLYYQGNAWEYAAQKGLSFPTKSRVFGKYMSRAKWAGKLSLLGTAAQLIYSEIDALTAEWEFANGQK
ncbi:MAG: hypothetical protein A2251_08760 [Elusimicrobia bacterium RIFOXYA2_FULL_47_53]|nr:MAG: hypothetical protein A2251_08760 [Elusimicrobia bacterium RIFOXYA2_FULL_47_53]